MAQRKTIVRVYVRNKTAFNLGAGVNARLRVYWILPPNNLEVLVGVLDPMNQPAVQSNGGSLLDLNHQHKTEPSLV